jgi:hypothetical protein
MPYKVSLVDNMKRYGQKARFFRQALDGAMARFNPWISPPNLSEISLMVG